MKITIKHKGKILIFSAAFMACMSILNPIRALAAQPHSSYWFPKQMLEWNPAKDKDAIFNRASIGLTNRFNSDKINSNASDKPKVMALQIMNSSTSGVPSQGSNKFDVHTFSYWQYVNTLIYWGGSSGEGLIVPPSADVIDSAHKNGVPVLGTVFFPPYVYGGKDEWLRDFLVKDKNGNFPVADKLLEVAKYYGFDGWFINQETGTRFIIDKNTLSKEDATLMKEFLAYLQKHKPSAMQIIWYDAMVDEGYVDWQNMLNEENKNFFGEKDKKVSDGMFLNFWWNNKGWYKRDKATIYYTDGTELKKSKDFAMQMGRNPFDLYAGVDVQEKGYETNVKWDVLFPNNNGNDAYTSLGLYCPSWTFFSAKTAEEYLKKESRLWVGESGDPRYTNTEHNWKGIANYVVEKAAVSSLPFTTNFNMGNGKFYTVDGKIVKNNEWNNRSLQDIMPTWRWVINNNGGNTLKPAIDYSTAYYGGSSLEVTGDLKANEETMLKLYKTQLPISDNTEVSLTYKSNTVNSGIKVALTFEGQENTEYLDLGNAMNTAWNTKIISLKQYAGKTLSSISLSFKDKNNIVNYEANIGQISIRNNNAKKALGSVSNLKVQETDFRDGIYTDARLAWDKIEGEVQQYEIYRIKPDGSKELLGATPNNAYYVQEMRRLDKEATTTLEIIPLDKNYKHGEASKATFQWTSYPKPKASFKTSTNFIVPGEEVKFTNTSSEVTEEVLWKFEGANIETSTEMNPVVKYPKQGIYSVTLIAKNTSGEDEVIKKDFITVTKSAEGGIKDLANIIAFNKFNNVKGEEEKKAIITASSFVNENEAPQFALDNKDNTKWCAVGDGSHWLKVNLGSPYVITEFKLKHAEAGGEGAPMNTRAYRIQVSQDGENWTDAVTIKDNTAGTTTHPVPVTKAQYIRLIIDKATQGGDTATRIYGFEIKGLETDKIVMDNGNGGNADNGSKPGNSNENSTNNTLQGSLVKTGSMVNFSTLVIMGLMTLAMGLILRFKTSVISIIKKNR